MDFSFMYADSNNAKSLKIGGSAFVLFPNEKHIYESDYEGNGVFNGRDIYEMVVEWNEEYLSPTMFLPPYASNYTDLRAFADAKRVHDKLCGMIDDLLTYPSTYMSAKYGSGYKHDIGVAIAGTDEQNLKLPFPIKISETAVSYNDVPASVYDPNLGVDIVYETTEEWHNR